MKFSRFIFLLAAAALLAAACDPAPSDEISDDNGKDKTETVTTDWSDPAWYSTNFWERTDREKAGIRGPVKKWHVSTYSTYTEYEYDREGHLVKETRIDTGDASDTDGFNYTYDSAGHLVRKEYFSQFTDEGFEEYTEYEYGNTGKFVASEFFMMGPSIVDAHLGICKDLSRISEVIVQPLSSWFKEYTFTFNADGNLTVKESSYSTEVGSEERLNESSYEYTYVYENGYPKSLDDPDLRFKLQNVTYYPNGMYKDFVYKEENAYNYDTGWDTHTYRMLDNPRVLAVERFELGGTPSYISLTPGRMVKTYDEHYDIIKNEEWYWEPNAVAPDGSEPTYTDTWRDFVYDKYGNWTTRIEHVIPRYTGEGYDATVTRVFEYFE